MQQLQVAHLQNPHDKLFQFTFQHPQHAASWLGRVLPSVLDSAVRWPSMRVGKERQTDERLRQYLPDLVLVAETASRDGHVWFVIEHKSYPAPDVHEQLLRYVVRLQQTLPTSGRNRITAIVLHHGAESFESGAVGDCSNESSAAEQQLRELQPRLPLLVDDLSQESEADLLTATGLSPLVRLTLLCLQHLPRATATDVPSAFERWANLLRTVDLMQSQPRGTDAVAAIGWYTLAVTEVSAAQLSETFGRILRRPEETIMSTLERTFLAGKSEGQSEGRVEGRAETILQMLELRFGSVSTTQQEHVRNATPEQLLTYTARILTAASADDVVAD